MSVNVPPGSPPDGPVARIERRLSLRYALEARGTAWSVARVAAGPFAVTATDISGIGMMLHSGAEELARFEPGDELLFGFPNPDQDNQVRLAGTLVWKHRGLMNLFGAWTFGIAFHDTPEAEIRKLLDPASRNAAPLREP